MIDIGVKGQVFHERLVDQDRLFLALELFHDK